MPRPLLPPSAANSHHAPHRKLQAAHLRLHQLQPHFSNNTTNPLHHQTHKSEAIVERHPSSSMNKSSWTQSTNLCMRDKFFFFFFWNPIWFGNEQSSSIEARYLQTLDFATILARLMWWFLDCYAKNSPKEKAKKSLIYMKRKAEKNRGKTNREAK